MISFKQDTELNVITEFDEATDNIFTSEISVFKAGERVDADIISSELREDGQPSEFVDIQFGDGSLATGVQRASFDILPSPIVQRNNA
jgi:hypothetical protein